MISAGDLTRTITVLGATVTQDALGQETQTDTTLRTVRAQRQQLRNSDIERAQLASAVAEARYRIRYTTGITPNLRIKEGATTYQIISVEEEGDRKALILICKVAS